MPRRRKRRSRGWTRRAAFWLCLAALAAGVGVLGGYLYRQVPPAPVPPMATRDAFRELLGPLDPRGTRVRVPDGPAAGAAVDRLRAEASRTPEARVGPAEQGARALRVTLHLGGEAYPVEFWWPGPAAPPEPRLVVVIDDLGGSREEAKAFLDLPLTVTPAILSNLPQSEAVARMARERGREFLLHLPMEPQGYPDVNPGGGALLSAMDEAQVRRAVAANLASVPGASGVNNHMGSRLTELPGPMRWVMDELGARGLYFLDSLTSPRSVAAETAARAGIRWARRDVFLDNVREDEAVGRQIEKAVALARKNGLAVAIGHPYPVTLRALERVAPSIRSEGVRIVPLGEVLRRGDGA